MNSKKIDLPSKEQLIYAKSLKIDSPEQYGKRELSTLISKKLKEKKCVANDTTNALDNVLNSVTEKDVSKTNIDSVDSIDMTERVKDININHPIKENGKYDPKKQSFVVFDVETTGTSHEDRIIEIGAVKAQFIDGYLTVVDRFDELIQVNGNVEMMYFYNPQLGIKQSISQLTGITHNDLVTKGKKASEALRDFYNFIHDGSLLIAHNHSFDMRMIGTQFAVLNIPQGKPFLRASVCTMGIAKKCFMKSTLYPNYKLESISKYCGFPMNKDEAHRAVYDAEQTLKCLNVMFNILDIDENTSVEEVILKSQKDNKLKKLPKKCEVDANIVKEYYKKTTGHDFQDRVGVNLLTEANIKHSLLLIETIKKKEDAQKRRAARR